MGDMAAGHEKVTVADTSDAVLFLGRTVDRDAFAYDVVIADHDLGIAACIAEILRLRSDHRARIDAIAKPQRSAAHQRHAVLEPRSSSDPNLRPDYAEGTNFHIRGDFRLWIDRCTVGNQS